MRLVEILDHPCRDAGDEGIRCVEGIYNHRAHPHHRLVWNRAARGTLDAGADVAGVPDAYRPGLLADVGPEGRVAPGDDGARANGDPVGKVELVAFSQGPTLPEGEAGLGGIGDVRVDDGVDHVETENLASVAQIDFVTAPEHVEVADVGPVTDQQPSGTDEQVPMADDDAVADLAGPGVDDAQTYPDTPPDLVAERGAEYPPLERLR